MAEQSKHTKNNSKEGMNKSRSLINWWKPHDHAEPTAVGDSSTNKYSQKHSSTRANLMHVKDYGNDGDKAHGGLEMVRHLRSEYDDAAESALKTEGGWTRPSLTGWKLPPDQPLQ